MKNALPAFVMVAMKRVNIPDQRTLGEGSSSCFNWDREKDYFESCCSLWHVNYLSAPPNFYHKV